MCGFEKYTILLQIEIINVKKLHYKTVYSTENWIKENDKI